MKFGGNPDEEEKDHFNAIRNDIFPQNLKFCVLLSGIRTHSFIGNIFTIGNPVSASNNI